MNPNRALKVALLLALIAAGVFAAWRNGHFRAGGGTRANSFDECITLGNPIMESYPRQCRAGGKVFREDVGNELEKDNLIRIAAPRPNDMVQSPLLVRGVARGGWFFEASFPARLLDEDGEMLAVVPAQAKNNPDTSVGVNWMTSDFVPFEATLVFEPPSGSRGTLVLEKDNPSGLPEHADSLTIPVRFK